ncbi:MAG: HAMP domain-containing protein [Melioribacteraceae bacterium]|nr:HAMP domain-containing protein [Melioribacteraceae bacterium]
MKNQSSSFKIYLSLLIILVLGIVFIETITPVGENTSDEDWTQIVNERNKSISKLTREKFAKTEASFLDNQSKLKKIIKNFETEKSSIQSELIDIINSDDFLEYNITVTDSGLEPIAWNDQFFSNSFYEAGIKKYGFNNSHFFTNELNTYLSIIDTVRLNNEVYYVFLSDIVEKHYLLKNRYFTHQSIKSELTDEIGIEFEIIFSDKKIRMKDKSKFLFDIKNLQNKTIATVIIENPIKEFYFLPGYTVLKNIQKIIFLILLLIISLFIYHKIKSISKFCVKEIFLITLILVFRILLFVFEIPKQYINSSLADSSYFSSKFGFGIVSSPLELFITVLFAFGLIYIIFNKIIGIKNLDEKTNYSLLKSILITIIISFVFCVFLRGFGASVKSVVFDSTLQYFKDISLLLGFPKTVMLFSLLGLGILSVWISAHFLGFNLKFFKDKKKSLLLLFLYYQFISLLYDYSQLNPQGTDFTRILYITLVFVIVYLIEIKHFEIKTVFIYLCFFASITSITHLIYFDHELELGSLKTKAIELVRPDEDLLEHQLRSVMNQFGDDEQAYLIFGEGSSNYDASAFSLWSNSLLHSESVNSAIVILDSSKTILGEFKFKFDKEIDYEELIIGNEEEIVVQEKDNIEENSSLLHGIIPFEENGRLLGYIVVSIFHDLTKVISKDELELLMADKVGLTSSSLKQNLNVLEFFDSRLIFSKGEINLSNQQLDKIANFNFEHKKEGWLNLSADKKDYRFFLLRSPFAEYDNVLAVGLEERNITINLFDFFKVFFIHTSIITLFVGFYLLILFIRNKELKITYKGQLLSAFLIISIIPLIMLAFYFRTLTEERNNSAIHYKLKKRAVSVDKYCTDNIKLENDIYTVFNNAHFDLGIDFSIYKGKSLIFSSEANYYQIGLFKDNLNAHVYKRLNIEGYRDDIEIEKVEDYKFNSFYYQTELNSEKYIIKINDTFNRILLPMSDTEVDVFLFGSYSLAVLLVIIISTVLANQISNPIKNITAATRDLAEGKMDITLENKSKGEIGELISGFNLMIKDLEKSRKELAEIERESAWREMARQVAHEIKNPLTPMKLSVQQLIIAFNDKSPKFNDIFGKVSTTIINQIDTLKNIANEFSNFARMPKLNIEKIELITVINESINLYMDKIVTLTLTSNYNEAFVNADLDQLKRAFINLIRNAIQARANKVEFILEKRETLYYIYVKDNGKGISEDIQHKIFDPDFTTKVEGMGLGLDMVKKFLNKVDGSIEIDETSKSGTIFLIKLPIAND